MERITLHIIYTVSVVPSKYLQEKWLLIVIINDIKSLLYVSLNMNNKYSFMKYLSYQSDSAGCTSQIGPKGSFSVSYNHFLHRTLLKITVAVNIILCYTNFIE